MSGITAARGRFDGHLAMATRKGAQLAIALALVCGAVAPAVAQQGLSDRAVKAFMNYAWQLTPQKFTKPDGKTVIIDRSKRNEVEVPPAKAAEIILAGRRSAHAQICGLKDEQIANYQSMMNRENASKKWSEQQMVYISQLHLTTIMLLTGKVEVVERQDGKVVVVDEKKAPVKTCTDEERTQVKRQIIEYLKTDPELKNAKKQG